MVDSVLIACYAGTAAAVRGDHAGRIPTATMALLNVKSRLCYGGLRLHVIGLLDKFSPCAETVGGLLGPDLLGLLAHAFGEIWRDHIPEERRFSGDHVDDALERDRRLELLERKGELLVVEHAGRRVVIPDPRG